MVLAYCKLQTSYWLWCFDRGRRSVNSAEVISSSAHILSVVAATLAEDRGFEAH